MRFSSGMECVYFSTTRSREAEGKRNSGMVVGELASSILSYFSIGPAKKIASKPLHATQDKRLKQHPTTAADGSQYEEGPPKQPPVMKDNFVAEDSKGKVSWRPFAHNSSSKSALESAAPEGGQTVMKKLKRSMSASSEGKLLSLIGLEGGSEVTAIEPKSRPASAFSALSTHSQPYTLPPVYASTHPNRVDTSPMALPDQVENVQTVQRTQLKPQSARPLSTREPNAIKVSSAQTDSTDTSSYSENDATTAHESRGFRAPSISPLYERQIAAPTPISTRSPTPLWDDGEKRVRFLESEVVGSMCSRPSSGTSAYSNIIKNTSRYSYAPNEPDSMYGSIGHSAKICNCPCHFFPKYTKSIGVQVAEKVVEPKRPLFLRPYHPRHYRLFILPTLKGLGSMPCLSMVTNFLVRALLSQIGLIVVVIAWWLVGALVFSTIEGPIQRGHVERMEVIREDLVIDLATELRQVRPYEAIWKLKIEEYMLKLENAVLRAVKSGYTSSRVTWTIADSFLYSVSLTTLLGPGGLVIHSSLTKVFSLVYASVGIPIIFLLLFNMAQTVREGLTRLWSWNRRRRQVSDSSLIAPTPSSYNASGATIHSVEAGSSHEISSSSVPRKERGSITKSSRVSLLENSLPQSRPGSAFTLPQDSRNGEDQFQVGGLGLVRKKPISSITSNETSSSNASQQPQYLPKPLPQTIQRTQSFLVNRSLIRQTLEREHFLGPKKTVPWILISLFPPFYIVLGTTLLSLTQNLSVVSALFVIGSNFLSLDHGGTGNRSLLTSENATFLYSLVVLIGVIFMLIFTLGMWPKVTSSLGEAGRNLSVVKQIELYR